MPYTTYTEGHTMNTTTFTVSMMTRDEDAALARLRKYLPDGFTATGRVVGYEYAGRLIVLEVSDNGGDRDDCWIVLTSYGMSPSDNLGAYWQGVEGVGC
jgi:hypothetical protein